MEVRKLVVVGLVTVQPDEHASSVDAWLSAGNAPTRGTAPTTTKATTATTLDVGAPTLAPRAQPSAIRRDLGRRWPDRRACMACMGLPLPGPTPRSFSTVLDVKRKRRAVGYRQNALGAENPIRPGHATRRKHGVSPVGAENVIQIR